MLKGKNGEAVRLFYVGFYEKVSEDGLNWHLLISEPVNTQVYAHRIFSYYERCWPIDEFHKAWKTEGT